MSVRGPRGLLYVLAMAALVPSTTAAHTLTTTVGLATRYDDNLLQYSDEQLALINKIKDGTAALEAKLKQNHPDWPQKLAAWQEETKKAEEPWQPLHPIEHEWVGGLAHPQKLPDNSVLTLGFRPSEGDLWVTADSKTAGATGLRLEALTTP